MTDQDTGDILTGKRIRLVSRRTKADRRGRHPALARWVASGAVLVLAAGSYAADQALSLSPASAAETYPTTIAAGYDHSCMIVTGQAYCWGDNTYGELGDDSTVSSTAPVPVDTSGVLSGVTLTQITAGNGYTCALASTGRAYCWGYNADGELGNGSTANSRVPVPVTTSGVLAGATLTQISAGEYAACGVSSAGAAYCWGQGTSGQLGNGGHQQLQPAGGGVHRRRAGRDDAHPGQRGWPGRVRAVQRRGRVLLGPGQLRPARQRRNQQLQPAGDRVGPAVSGSARSASATTTRAR